MTTNEGCKEACHTRAVPTRPETVAASGIQAGDWLELMGRWRVVREVRCIAGGARRVELGGKDVLVLHPLRVHVVHRPVRRQGPTRVVRWPGDGQPGGAVR